MAKKARAVESAESVPVDPLVVEQSIAETVAAEHPSGEVQNFNGSAVYVPGSDDTAADGSPVHRPARPADDSNGPVETKAQKFVRLATRRVTNAIKVIRRIAPLANRSQYESTEEQRRTMLLALVLELRQLEQRFAGERVSEAQFRF